MLMPLERKGAKSRLRGLIDLVENSDYVTLYLHASLGSSGS